MSPRWTPNDSRPSPSQRAPERLIEPPSGIATLGAGELWRHRELLYFIAWRDVKVRYKQTLLGATWAIVQPVLTLLVFTVFFGSWLGLDRRTSGIDYAPYVLAGLVPWTFFANAVSNATASLVTSANLVSKVHFPRVVIPLGALGASMVDLGIASVVYAGVQIWFGPAPGGSVLLAPLLVAGVIMFAAAVSVLLSGISVTYRDVRYALPFVVQLWLFVTPVIYPLDVVPERWRWIVYMNPMAGYISAIRSSVFDAPIPWAGLVIAVGVTFLLGLVALVYFRTVERRFADII